jgi:hypothetical protein
MTNSTSRNRKWERYVCLLPCHVIPETDADLIIPARIINIGRGGILIEADYDFPTGTRVIISSAQESEPERFDASTKSTARCDGQIDRVPDGVCSTRLEFETAAPQSGLRNSTDP